MTYDQDFNEIDEIEALLPWHAAGKLSGRDARRVEAALAENAELARHYALVREELAETICLNESLGAPSTRALERLMRGIEAEPPRRQRISLNVAGWFGSKLSQLSPRTLSWATATAALLIVVQAGVLTDVLVGREGQTYGTASAPSRSMAEGPHALIGFVPQASAADLTRFLDAYKASIVEGPRAGGLYRIQFQPGLSKNDVAGIVKRMQQDSRIVRFAATAD